VLLDNDPAAEKERPPGSQEARRPVLLIAMFGAVYAGGERAVNQKRAVD
jgi:hypothetical protein